MQVYHSGRSSEVAAALYVEAKMKEPLAFHRGRRVKNGEVFYLTW